jgi:hypothetical protein
MNYTTKISIVIVLREELPTITPTTDTDLQKLINAIQKQGSVYED